MQLFSESYRVRNWEGKQVEVSPLTRTIGAEVEGLDLGAPCNEECVARLRNLLLHHGVLVFRNQLSLTRSRQVELARCFGELETYNGACDESGVIVQVHHDSMHPPTENVWHSDMSFRPNPPLGALLRAIVVPPTGGDTVFADMREAWKLVPRAIQELVGTMLAEHDIAKLADADSAARLHQVAPPTQHPVQRVHVETGESVLYVNSAYTTKIVGLSKVDSDTVLHHLLQYVNVPEVQCRVRWYPGTVVMFDNRALQHYAVADYFPATRTLERATIQDQSHVLRRTPRLGARTDSVAHSGNNN